MSNHLSIGYYWKYNPLQNKPTTLDPVEPWGSYYYYGPDPAAGCSYGLFEDEEHDFKMLSCDSEKVYSPASGKEMAKVEDVPADEVKELLSKTGASAGVHRVQCQGCKASMMCSRDLTEADIMHCAACGCVMVGCDTSGKKEDQTMATLVKKEGASTLKDRIRASIQKKRAAAKAAAAPAKELTLAQKLRERVLARRAAKASEEKEEKHEDKKDDEYVSLDTIMEAMDEEEGKEAGDDKAKAEDDTEEFLHEEKHEDSKDGAATSEEKEEVKVEEKEEGKDKDEEFMDLDMVLSMLKRKARVAKARARIKARREAKAAMKVKADEKEEKKEPKVEEKKAKADDTEEFEHDPKHEESKDGAATADEKADESAHEEKEPPYASEPKVEQEQPGLSAQKPAEPGIVQQDNPVPGAEHGDGDKMGELHSPKKEGEMDMSKESEAMRFEPLASTDKLSTVAKEDIDMMLYGEEGENPTWNVSVAGVPTCRIPLKAQAHADDIRKVFCSDEYALDLIEHCVKSGFVPTMKKVGATFWANHTSDRKIAARYQTMASAAIDTEKSKIVAAFREDFISALKIVTAGMSKNFYPELGNSLKDSFFNNLCTAGLPKQTAISVVEKSFAEGSSEYFNTLFDKATDYLNLTRETRAEIANAIAHSSTLELASDSELQSAPATLADRLTQASATAQVAQQFQVTQPVSIDADDFKNQLKGAWNRRR